MFAAEQQLQILINRVWVAPWADRGLSFVSNFSAWRAWLLLLVVLAVIFGNFRMRAALVAVLVAVGFSDGIGVNLLKHAVARPRPSQVEPGVRWVSLGAAPRVAGWPLPKIFGLLSEPVVQFPRGTGLPGHAGLPDAVRDVSGRSFPSGHAANNMAVATVLILFFRWRGAFYLPLALLVCYARIYTGDHWPLDVAAAILLGVTGGLLGTWLLEFLWKRFGAKILPMQAVRHPSLLR